MEPLGYLLPSYYTINCVMLRRRLRTKVTNATLISNLPILVRV